jgi:hypothetical protein
LLEQGKPVQHLVSYLQILLFYFSKWPLAQLHFYFFRLQGHTA